MHRIWGGIKTRAKDSGGEVWATPGARGDVDFGELLVLRAGCQPQAPIPVWPLTSKVCGSGIDKFILNGFFYELCH